MCERSALGLLLEQAVKSTSAGILIGKVDDPDFPVVYANPAFERLVSRPESTAVGKGPWFLERDGAGVPAGGDLRARLATNEKTDVVLERSPKDGGPLCVELAIAPLCGPDGKAAHYVATHVDVTRWMDTAAQRRWALHHDPVTGLPNRHLLSQRLRHALVQARRHKRSVAVLVLDVDRFRTINDALGYSAGDRLLRSIAERLKEQVRDDDTVARLGDDEFTLVLADVAAPRDAAPLARRTMEAFGEPFRVSDRDVFATASMGVALFPLDGEDAETLIKNAETAARRAKAGGRNHYQFFAPDFHESAQKRLAIENDLRRALDRDELVVHYQPKVDLTTGAVTGMEALVRWMHPDLGMVSPADFIPIAEETGLIVPLGRYVLRAACAQALAWGDGGRLPRILSVNVSGRQFKEEGLADSIAGVLADTGFDPGRLELELTESTLMGGGAETLGAMNRLKSLGAQLSIDDFGTGYSSLSYLRRFPIDTIKIDRTFVKDIATSAEDRVLANSIIGMAHALRLKTVAEGVEKQDQFDILRGLACDAAQGYFVSRPLPADAFGRWRWPS